MDFSDLTDTEKITMIDETIEKLNSLATNPDLTQSQMDRLEANLSNIETIKTLYIKIDSDSSDDIRKKYLMVAKERNAYFEKLRALEQLGEANNWTSDTGELEKILNIIK